MTTQIASPISIGHDLVVEIVPLKKFDRMILTGESTHFANGCFVKMSQAVEAGRTRLLFAGNPEVPYPVNINQDTSYLLRREIAEMLRGFRQDPFLKLSPDVLASLQVAIWHEACPLPEDDLLTLCASNTQDMLDSVIDALEPLSLERLAETAVTDPAHKDYRHTRGFAPLYLHTSRVIASVAESRPGDERIVVADLGCGRGSGILSCARELGKRNLLSRVRFVGIDISARDLRVARALVAKRMPELDVEFLAADLLDGHLGDLLRERKPAVVMCQHVIEHVQGPLENRILQDMLHAAQARVCVSVPLNDRLATTISSHVHEFDVERVMALGKVMEVRCAKAVKCVEPEWTARIGLIDWAREPREAFGREHVLIRPGKREVSQTADFGVFRKPFDPRLLNAAHRAVKIGSVPNPGVFAREGTWPQQVRQMVIKKKGKDLFVPAEFAQCAGAIQVMAEHNMAINPDYEEYYACLNVFRGPMSFDAYRGLSLNLHGDQFQNLRGENAYYCDYSYICSNTLSTIFFDQTFDISEAIDLARKRSQPVNLYDWLNRQARDDARYYSDDFGIYLLSPYVIHSAQAAVERNGEFRIFLKVAFSRKRFFDNRELRVNHALDCSDWLAGRTVGFSDGWLNHAHWNERFLWEDLKSDSGM